MPNPLRRITNSFQHGGFARNIATLMSGTAASELLVILASLALTRLYPPHEYGIFAAYSAAVAILASVITGNYEQGIVLPDSNEDAWKVAKLCFGISLSSIILVEATFVLSPSFFGRIIGITNANTALYLVPGSALVSSTVLVLTLWNIRQKSFTTISKARISQALTSVSLQLGLAAASNSYISLIAGQIIGQVISIFTLRNKRPSYGNETLQTYMITAKKYADFPRYMLPASLVNKLSTFLPVFALGAAFSSETIGLFALSQRVIRTPMSVIGGSVADAFLKKADELHRRSPGILKKKCRNLVFALLAIGSIPTAILVLLGPTIFDFTFGSDWTLAGKYAQIMAVYLWFQFAFSPLCRLYSVLEKQKIYNYWEFIRLMLVSAGLGFGIVSQSPMQTVTLFSIAMALSYIILGFMTFKVLNKIDA